MWVHYRDAAEHRGTSRGAEDVDTAIELICAIYNSRCNDIRVVRIGACNCDVFTYDLKADAGVGAAVNDNHIAVSCVIYGFLNC